jgi:hypothetical protein
MSAKKTIFTGSTAKNILDHDVVNDGFRKKVNAVIRALNQQEIKVVQENKVFWGSLLVVSDTPVEDVQKCVMFLVHPQDVTIAPWPRKNMVEIKVLCKEEDFHPIKGVRGKIASILDRNEWLRRLLILVILIFTFCNAFIYEGKLSFDKWMF